MPLMLTTHLVAIEGIDGVGKGTQSRLLADHLAAEGYRVALFSFPMYDTFFGRMVGEYLNGNYGTLHELPPKLCALLYAMDRWDWARRTSLDCYDIVVIDRYVPSNLAHQGAKAPAKDQDALIQWVMDLEYTVMGIPRPDLTVILDASSELAREQVLLKAKRAYTDRPLDIHEEDASYLDHVRELFANLSVYHPNLVTVNCGDKGAMRSIDEIAGDIWREVYTHLSLKQK